MHVIINTPVSPWVLAEPNATSVPLFPLPVAGQTIDNLRVIADESQTPFWTVHFGAVATKLEKCFNLWHYYLPYGTLFPW